MEENMEHQKQKPKTNDTLDRKMKNQKNISTLLGLCSCEYEKCIP